MQKRKLLIKKLGAARIMMIAAILLIVVFQGYWLTRLYHDERETLKKETNGIFRDLVYNLQLDRFNSETFFLRDNIKPNLAAYNAVNALRKKVYDLKKDSSVKSVRFDSTNMIFVVEGSHDSGTVKPRITIRGNMLPPGADAIIRRELGSKANDLLNDTSLVRRLNTGMSGMSIVLRSSKGDTALPKELTEHRTFKRAPLPLPAFPKDSLRRVDPGHQVNVRFDPRHPERTFVRMVTDGKFLADTISLTKLDSAYRKELSKNNISLAFTLKTGRNDSLHKKDTISSLQFSTRPAIVGFAKPNWYQAGFENPAGFLFRKISPQILFSLFLVAFTTVAFIFLYRNLASQRRLTEMKNDFISNITHELKTPIATVSVAVEALRNFGGMQNPERTKEYLDISAAELQRLGLLVDKVLKLSLFENRELELKKQDFDLKDLLTEVLNTMRLQFEKHHARLDLQIQGQYFNVNADRLHITSVIYNLLDNALKYSNGKPDIAVLLQHETDHITLKIADKGIGIAAAYQGKIFDKFFRVPTGDHHNIKGYGLGLSYVAHVIRKHEGSISVDSEPGKGSTFTIKLPVA